MKTFNRNMSVVETMQPATEQGPEETKISPMIGNVSSPDPRVRYLTDYRSPTLEDDAFSLKSKRTFYFKEHIFCYYKFNQNKYDCDFLLHDQTRLLPLIHFVGIHLSPFFLSCQFNFICLISFDSAAHIKLRNQYTVGLAKSDFILKVCLSMAKLTVF